MATVEGVRDCIVNFGAIQAALPAAQAGAKLRACGIRLVGETETLEALKQLAAEGNQDAEMVLANILPRGHAEVC